MLHGKLNYLGIFFIAIELFILGELLLVFKKSVIKTIRYFDFYVFKYKATI
jgi:hypothetical protein